MDKYIAIPYFSHYGGPGTFILNLTDGFENPVFTNKIINKTRLILIITYFNPIKLMFYRFLLNKKVILRLDEVRIPVFRFTLKALKSVLIYHTIRFIYYYVSDYNIFQSKYVYNRVLNLFGNSQKPFRIIFNGIEPLFSNRKLIDDQFIVLSYWGSTISTEELDLLISISNKLSSDGLRHQLNIIGRPPLESDINLNTNLGTNIFFYGKLDLKEVYKVAKSTDLFLMVKGSASPNALVECLAFSIPVVGFSNKGNIEIIPDNIGFMFEKEEIKERNIIMFSKGINHIIKNYNDFSDKIKIHFLTNFTKSIMQEKYFEVFNYLISKRSKGSS